jgi:hypothetical protein
VTCLSGSDRHLSLPGGMVRGTSTVQPRMGWLGRGAYGTAQANTARDSQVAVAHYRLCNLWDALDANRWRSKSQAVPTAYGGAGCWAPGEALMQGSPQPIVGGQVVGIVRRHAL